MTHLSSKLPISSKLNSPLDPEQEIAQLLALEFARSHGRWKRISGRRRAMLLASVMFLVAIVVAGCFAFFIFFSPDRVTEMRGSRTGDGFPNASPTSSP